MNSESNTTYWYGIYGSGILAGYDCIMDVFDDSAESVAKRCGDSCANCEKCLQSWLNEYPF